jgi:hypothetical protein
MEGIRRPKNPRRKRINTNRERSRKNEEKSRLTGGRKQKGAREKFGSKNHGGASLSSTRKCSPFLQIRSRIERESTGPEEPRRRGREDKQEGEAPPS